MSADRKFGPRSVAVSVSAIVLSVVVTQTSAACLSATGKIFNNLQADGHTLGVVALNLGDEKLKCAISGAPQVPGPPNYLHTVVCDDKAAPGDAQAQVTFATSFAAAPVYTSACPAGSPGGPYAFTFVEISTPLPGTGRGAFDDVSGGALNIQGQVNCQGGITMKFTGSVCFAN